MKFAIITQVPHYYQDGRYFSYGPYVKEMNIWLKYADDAILVAPLQAKSPTAIDLPYDKTAIDFRSIPSFHIKNLVAAIGAISKLPKTCVRIVQAMKQADHIHLRCPGNIGLLACIFQIFFRGKTKTAKYAGNWDPASKQPWSYKLQQYILSNTWLTCNMTVLVYGNWPGSSRNIKPFFTATYGEADKQLTSPRLLNGKLLMLFVGTLSTGKRPLYALQLLQTLRAAGHHVVLEIYGEGPQRGILEKHINENQLHSFVTFKGNQPASVIQSAFQNAQLVVLPSQSEGWPKVLAEAMFWGCVPVSSRVSCVPDMLDNGKRGLLLDMNLPSDSLQIDALLHDSQRYEQMALQGMAWSRHYTLDLFEQEIKILMQNP